MAASSTNSLRVVPVSSQERVRRILNIVGPYSTRYLLVGVIVLNAALKWTRAEATAIQPFLTHSPFYAWLFLLGDAQAVSELFGVIELATAVLLALRPFAPRLSFIGSMMAAVMFLSTISFLVTTPGIATSAAGGFLIKDFVFLGVAFWTAADSLNALVAQRDKEQRQIVR